jgi:hypothetical protein
MEPRSRSILVVSMFVAAVLVAGCASDGPPVSDASAAASAAGDGTLPPDRDAAPDPTAVANEAAFGPWRPAPIQPSSAVASRVEAVCRADALVGDAPLMVLDARGEGLFTLVFGGDAPALCRATMADAEADPLVVVRPVGGGADAPAPEAEGLGIHDLEAVDPGSRPRNVLVGRVGDDVPAVSVNHDDATWTKAAIGNGWYAVWWPLAKEAIGVAGGGPPHPGITRNAP